jgi:hypothetical protein
MENVSMINSSRAVGKDKDKDKEKDVGKLNSLSVSLG